MNVIRVEYEQVLHVDWGWAHVIDTSRHGAIIGLGQTCTIPNLDHGLCLSIDKDMEPKWRRIATPHI